MRWVAPPPPPHPSGGPKSIGPKDGPGPIGGPGPGPAPACKCLPGDACWPAEDVWAKFNSTVGNRLFASEPIGSPCHDPNYDEAACEALKNSWTNPLTQ